MNILKTLATFLGMYWIDVIVILILIAISIAVYKKSKTGRTIILNKLIELVMQADELFDSGTGQIKFAFVYNRLPFIVKLLYKKDELYKLVDSILDNIINILKQKIKDGSTDEEGNT